MKNPFTLYEQEVMSALYTSLNFCEEYDLPTKEILKALSYIEGKKLDFEGYKDKQSLFHTP